MHRHAPESRILSHDSFRIRFCKNCVELDSSTLCAACNTDVGPNGIADMAHIDKILEDEAALQTANAMDMPPSTKAKALIRDLQANPLSKAVVFSQWTSMLNLLHRPLQDAGIKFVRLDGSMRRQLREASLEQFANDEDTRVFLISLKAGGVGLNLTAASRVYLMDPWWNPSVEHQAVDRIHRLGQTKPVYTIRFVAKDTIEEKILQLQQHKAELAQMTFVDTLRNRGKNSVRWKELKEIFEQPLPNR